MTRGRNAHLLRGALVCAVVLLAATAPALAICLDWPMGSTVSSQVTPGYNIEVVQNYANTTHPTYGPRAHSGLDLKYSTGGTANKPVYAAADGVVKYRVNCCYPGGVLVIEHDLGGGDVIYTMYGHISSILVNENDSVTRGQQIASILDQDSVGNSHLHFEVRDWLTYAPNGTKYGPGYAQLGYHPDDEGWHDPTAEVYSYRPAFPGTAVFDTQRDVRTGPSTSYSYITTVGAGSQVTLEDVSADSNGGGHYWYEIRYDGVNTGWANVFLKGSYGAAIFAGEPWRSCGGGGGGGYSTVIDDSSSTAYFYGPSQYWWEVWGYGQSGQMHYTWNSQYTEGNYVYWGFYIPTADYYKIETFIPSNHATTTNAQYYLWNGGSWSFLKSVNQNGYYNAWVPLTNSVYLTPGWRYVKLTDVTLEPSSTRKVGFDAIRVTDN